jgi:hypothetical protein
VAESGSFLKKRTKKLLQIQAEPLRKGRSQLSKSFLLLFFQKSRPSLLSPDCPAGEGKKHFVSEEKTR